MSSHTNSWNDDRLDELSGRVDAGFAKVDREMKEGFARVDSEMKEGFARIDSKLEKVDERLEPLDRRFATKDDMNRGFSEVKGELGRLNERFDRLLHALMMIAWGFAGTVLAALIGLVVVLL